MPICVKWICKRKFYCATKVLHCSTQTPELPQNFQVEQFFVRGSYYTTIYCHPSMKLSCLSLCSGPVQCDHCPWCIGTIQGPPPVQGSCPTPAAPLVQGPEPWLPSVECPSPAPGYVQTCSTWTSAYKNLPPPPDMVKLIHYEAFPLKCFRVIKKIFRILKFHLNHFNMHSYSPCESSIPFEA